MNPEFSNNHSSAWTAFTYANVAISLLLTIGALFFVPLDMWIRGYFLMGIAMLVSSTVNATKMMRDIHESHRLVNKIEDAKTEQLLMRMKE